MPCTSGDEGDALCAMRPPGQPRVIFDLNGMILDAEHGKFSAVMCICKILYYFIVKCLIPFVILRRNGSE